MHGVINLAGHLGQIFELPVFENISDKRQKYAVIYRGKPKKKICFPSAKHDKVCVF